MEPPPPFFFLNLQLNCNYPDISVGLNIAASLAYHPVSLASLLIVVCFFYFKAFYLCVFSALYCCVGEAQGRG